MDKKQAWIRVSALGGATARIAWAARISVPPGVGVDVVDFGYRVSVTATRGDDEITLVADLATGDAAQVSTASDDDSLVRFARRVLAYRMALDVPELGPAREPTTDIRDLVEATGAKWIRTDLEEDDEC